MLSGEGGIYFPQNSEYTKTSEMVREISVVAGKKIVESRGLGVAVKAAEKVPGKIGGLVDKAFGNLTYDQRISQYEGIEYQNNTLKESIEKTEGITESKTKKHILVISQYFYPEQFRINDMACEWVKRGYKVTVLTGIPNYPMGKYFEGYANPGDLFVQKADMVVINAVVEFVGNKFSTYQNIICFILIFGIISVLAIFSRRIIADRVGKLLKLVKG